MNCVIGLIVVSVLILSIPVLGFLVYLIHDEKE
jgi:hypothetical protein